MSNFILGFVIGISGFMVVQMNGFCGTSCKEAYIKSAIEDPLWSKDIWEEIAERVMK